MNDDNSRMAIYISIMTLVFSCVGLGYGLIFFGWGAGQNLTLGGISPRFIIGFGLIIAAMNGISANMLSDELSRTRNTWPPFLRVGVPLTIFFITLAISIVIALISV